MLFIVITVISLAGVLVRQTWLRFAEAEARAGKNPAAATPRDEPSRRKWTPGRSPGPRPPWSDYGKWLGRRTKSAFTKTAFRNMWAVFSDWAKSHYPGWTKWIFAGFGLSLVYLAASGLFYALFIPRGMSGFPLLGHMGFGGLFALTLAALLLWRGRAYVPDKGEAEIFEAFACPIFKNLSKSLLRKILFWTLAFLGFVLIATALGSMLPLFVFDAQRTFIGIHRYAALGMVLTVIVFVDITFVPSSKA
jgi:hypothetical protein